jgi:hypothetical protein
MGLFTNSLFIVLCIDIMLMISFILGGTTINESNVCGNMLTSFLNIDYGNQTIKPSSNATATIPTTTDQGSFGTITGGTSVAQFSFIDGLKMIFSVLLLFIGLIFAPLCTGLALSFPLWLQLLVCVPLTFAGLLGIIYLIRGLSN